MRTLRTLIVDDERIGRQRLRRMLEREADVEILAECADGPAAVAAVREHAPDVLFLDINMPGMDGFGALDALGPDRQPPVVIFVTAYDEHAVRAFEACALDYLLKPASPERLAKAVARAREQLTLARGDNAETDAPAPSSQRFVARSGGRVSFIAPEEIDWVEAAGNYMILHVGPHNHMVRETMSDLETGLAALDFLRVSRSALVNLRRVTALHTSPDGENVALLADDQRVPITRSLREVTERLAAL